MRIFFLSFFFNLIFYQYKELKFKKKHIPPKLMNKSNFVEPNDTVVQEHRTRKLCTFLKENEASNDRLLQRAFFGRVQINESNLHLVEKVGFYFNLLLPFKNKFENKKGKILNFKGKKSFWKNFCFRFVSTSGSFCFSC